MPRPAPANALQALAPAPPARTWLALVALAILSSLGVAWSFAGRVPVLARGDGVMVRGDVPVAVTSPSPGRVTKVHRAAGDSVSAGETIAEVDAPDVRLQLMEAQGLLTALQQSDRNLRAEEQQAIAAIAAAMAKADGAVLPEAQVLERLDDAIAARSARAAEIERVSATVRRLIQMQEEMTQVRATSAGTVIEILAEGGSGVERGTSIALVAPAAADGRIRCVASMRDADPGRIAAGMRVRLSPERTRPEVHGLVQGVVERVTAGSSADAPETVVVLVDEDAASPSGMAWVGGAGYPDRMPAVSRAEIIVTVDEVAPIALAMPWLTRQ